MISVFVALGHTPAYTAISRIRDWCIRGVPVCFWLSMVLISSIHGGMARLSWPSYTMCRMVSIRSRLGLFFYNLIHGQKYSCFSSKPLIDPPYSKRSTGESIFQTDMTLKYCCKVACTRLLPAARPASNSWHYKTQTQLEMSHQRPQFLPRCIECRAV